MCALWVVLCGPAALRAWRRSILELLASLGTGGGGFAGKGDKSANTSSHLLGWWELPLPEGIKDMEAEPKKQAR